MACTSQQLADTLETLACWVEILGETNRLRSHRFRDILLVLLFSVIAFAVTGYHPGFEDDAVYLAAVKHDVTPTLFPYDASFFTMQLQATIFDRVIAGFVNLTSISVAWAELIFQGLSVLVIIWSGFLILRGLFKEPAAQWGGVALLAAMFTLPVSGTALYIVDQHLHPRNLATALIMMAIERLMARQRWQAGVLLLLAFLFHPIMGAMGISLCLFLALAQIKSVRQKVSELHESPVLSNSAAAFIPLGWVFAPPTETWRKALSSRTYYFLYQWQWYEWLGAIGPLVLFWLLARWADKREDKTLSWFAWGVLAFGVVQQSVAMVMTGPDSLIRLIPLQPMRYLQIIYVLMTLIGGALIGKYLLKTKIWRWAVYLLLFNGVMFAVQRDSFAGSEHFEFPGQNSANPWMQAFEWIRLNTPQDAYFEMDPRYMSVPGENYHSFRALAERSMLTDGIKDTAVTTQVPELAVIWNEQQQAQAGWEHFGITDFERLKARYGVNWVLISTPPPAGLNCRWHNSTLTVCQIP